MAPSVHADLQATRHDAVASLDVDEQRLDLLSVPKASQTISSEIEPTRLLDAMMGIVIEYAGRQLGCLILEEGGELNVRARVKVQQTMPHAGSPMSPSSMPLSLMQHVQKTCSKVLFAVTRSDPQFIHGPYVERHKSKSVLCIPVVRQRRFMGMFYLENNLLADAFNEQHLHVLAMLASQAAISIDNAQF